MVTVTSLEERKNAKGEAFMALILTGDLEIVNSQTSGKQYATMRKISIPSTFDEETAKSLIGKQIKGEIQRVPCPEYEYTSKKTGDVLTLSHQYVYNPNPSNVAENVFAAGNEM